MGSVAVPEGLRALGLVVTSLAERYGVHEGEDVFGTTWMPEAAAASEAVLMADANTRRKNPEERRVLVRHRVQAFVVVGRDHASAIGTLVERQTRLVRLLHLPTVDAAGLHRAIANRVGDLSAGLRRSITWDQGIEVARHLESTAELGLPVYSCDSHGPGSGSNENANGLLRQHFASAPTSASTGPEHLRGPKTRSTPVRDRSSTITRQLLSSWRCQPLPTCSVATFARTRPVARGSDFSRR